MSVKKLMQLYEGIVGQVPDADIAQDIEMRRYVPLKNTGYKAQLGVKLSADISSVTIHQGKNAPQLFSARHWHAGTLLGKDSGVLNLSVQPQPLSAIPESDTVNPPMEAVGRQLLTEKDPETRQLGGILCQLVDIEPARIRERDDGGLQFTYDATSLEAGWLATNILAHVEKPTITETTLPTIYCSGTLKDEPFALEIEHELRELEGATSTAVTFHAEFPDGSLKLRHLQGDGITYAYRKDRQDSVYPQLQDSAIPVDERTRREVRWSRNDKAPERKVGNWSSIATMSRLLRSVATATTDPAEMFLQ